MLELRNQLFSGIVGTAGILSRMGVDTLGNNTLSGFRKENKCRIANAQNKCSTNYRKRRQQLRQIRKNKVNDKQSYLSGAFGVNKHPDSAVADIHFETEHTTVDHVNVTFVDDNEILFITNLVPVKD